MVEVLAKDNKANELTKIAFKRIEVIMVINGDSGSADKSKALVALAQKRRAANWEKCRDISTYHGGAYDCEHVSPYTKGANNLNSEIFVMLQDWSSYEFLENLYPESAAGIEVRETGRRANLPTNRNLCRLLNTHFSLALEQVYATNLFPFIKQGNLGADIPQRFLVMAAKEFALPQVRIVKPKVVICFGLATFNAIRDCYSKPKCSNVKAAIDSSFIEEGVRFWAQAHPGSRGRNNRNRLDKSQVENDWQRMKNSLAAT